MEGAAISVKTMRPASSYHTDAGDAGALARGKIITAFVKFSSIFLAACGIENIRKNSKVFFCFFNFSRTAQAVVGQLTTNYAFDT